MDVSETVVFFNGRFWVAVALRKSEDGKLAVARHVFGPEPSNPDLLQFYLNLYEDLHFFKSDSPLKELERSMKRSEDQESGLKAHEAYKESLKKELAVRKAGARRSMNDSAKNVFIKKQLKKKKKRRGH